MKFQSGSAALIGVVGFIGMLLLTMLWGGYVFSVLWGWFVVPLGVKALAAWHGVGVVLLSRMAVGYGRSGSKDEELSDKMLTGLIVPLLFLGIGYVIHLFM